MNIIVVHTHKTAGLDPNQVIYLGRGAKNKFPILANDWSHLPKSMARHKVETVEEAVSCFQQDLVQKLKSGSKIHQVQMRGLYNLTVSLANNGDVYYACWCKHEIQPSSRDHSCHCDSLRSIVLSKYRKENTK